MGGSFSTEGYLTSFTETDPVFSASAASGITSTNITNWNTAYSWGDHSTEGYLTSFTETDPVFSASAASGITSTNITNWNTAYGWGDHSTEGYLTSFTETDPTVPAHVKSITTTEKTNWNTAYSWGDHSTAGYQSASTALTTSTTFGGDVSGTYNAIVIADDSHNHVISNVDGLQTALDGKLSLTGGTLTGSLKVNTAMTLNSEEATLATTTQTQIANFSATTYGGGKFVITAKDGVNRHICELLVTHDGTTAVATQYGSVTTASDLATYDVDISGGNVRILATSASTNSTVYKVAETLMEA
jgi:hypothetical protein